jgi:hypothetical protein
LSFSFPTLVTESIVAVWLDGCTASFVFGFGCHKTPFLYSSIRIEVGFLSESVGEQASKLPAPAYDIIHCATHGIFGNRHPLHLFLLLAKAKGGANDDGLLEAR